MTNWFDNVKFLRRGAHGGHDAQLARFFALQHSCFRTDCLFVANYTSETTKQFVASRVLYSSRSVSKCVSKCVSKISARKITAIASAGAFIEATVSHKPQQFPFITGASSLLGSWELKNWGKGSSELDDLDSSGKGSPRPRFRAWQQMPAA